ncbi:MAG: hypothetical protein DHS20C12_29270 [Pseudohongiella sp.]|nr:MAG: hypothetical protein DHS20C12_29270 [Pseudohongiella sp.]
MLLIAAPTEAGTIVRVSTTLGDFSIELLDDIAPKTVANFLGYVERNAYNGNYIHRAPINFVIQTGGYRFEPFVGPIPVPADNPVVNEFNVSNTRGTVAMAKFGGDPDSATSEWFVSVADNSANLDNQNGGFTVFGNVLGDGMVIVDAISALPKLTLGIRADEAPITDSLSTSPLDFVYINVEVTKRFSGAKHVFEDATGLMISSVNIDNESDLVSLNFNLVPHESDIVVKVNRESVIPLLSNDVGIATYSSADQRLRIPALEVNLGGNVSVFNNVVFRLSNEAELEFTLESFDPQ